MRTGAGPAILVPTTTDSEPMATRPTSSSKPDLLYEDDFYAWTRHQAQALRRLARTRPNLDLAHLVDEVQDLGKSARDAVRSHVRTIVAQLCGAMTI